MSFNIPQRLSFLPVESRLTFTLLLLCSCCIVHLDLFFWEHIIMTTNYWILRVKVGNKSSFFFSFHKDNSENLFTGFTPTSTSRVCPVLSMWFTEPLNPRLEWKSLQHVQRAAKFFPESFFKQSESYMISESTINYRTTKNESNLYAF